MAARLSAQFRTPPTPSPSPPPDTMPTTTTTVTTTSATGTTTETVTVTTAESKVANPDVASLTAAVGEWGAGTLAANKAKYYSADCQIKAGRGTVPGWPASVTQDESFDAWCVPAAVHSVVVVLACAGALTTRTTSYTCTAKCATDPPRPLTTHRRRAHIHQCE